MSSIARILAQQVNTTPANNPSTPAAAALEDGGHVVTWTAFDPGGAGWIVRAQRFDAAGAAAGGEVLVDTSVGGLPASVAPLSEGGYVLAWSAPDDSGLGVKAQRYDSGGLPVGGAIPVNATTAGSQLAEAVAGRADGGFLVVWTSRGADPSGDVYLQRFSAAGAPVGGEVEVNTTTTGFQVDASVAELAGGGQVVTWTSGVLAGSADIYAQRYDAGGAALGDEVRVNTTTVDNQTDSAVAALTGGGYVVVWASTRPGEARADVYAQRFSAAGDKLGPEIRVNLTSPDGAAPSVAPLSNDGFAVGWSSLATLDNGPAPQAGLYFQQFEASGARVGPEVFVNAPDPLLTNGAIAAPEGRIVVTWDTGPGDAAVVQRGFGPFVSGDTLSEALEVASGDSKADTFFMAPGALTPGDQIYGGAGHDRIRLTAPGTADFTGVHLVGVEALLGSRSDDTFVLPTRPPALVEFEGGRGFDTLIVGGDLNLAQVTGIERITTLTGASAVFQVAEVAQLELIHGGAEDDLVVDASSLILNAEQRAALFSRGVDLVLQAEGRAFDATGLAWQVLGEGVVNTTPADPSSFQNFPATASLADGYVTVWTSADAQGANVFGQRFDAAGNKQGGEFQVNTTMADDQRDPSAVGLADGGYVVSWTSRGQDGDGFGIFAQRFDAAGAKVGGEILVNSRTEDSQFDSSVAALADGGFVVTWTDEVTFEFDDPAHSIHARRFDATGAPIGDAVTVAADKVSSGVAALADGGFVVVYEQDSDDGGTGARFFQRYTAEGQPVGAETAVSGTWDEPGAQVLAGLDDGGFILTWSTADGLASSVFTQRYDATGAAVGGVATITTSASGQALPSVAASPDGGYALSWLGANGVIAQQFDAAGAPLTRPLEMSAVGQFPSVAALASGAVVAVWKAGPVVEQQVFAAIDYHLLTPGADAVAGTSVVTLVIAGPDDLGAGDSLAGGAGQDRLELAAAGVLDLTAPASFAGFEAVVGSSGADTFVVDDARLADVRLIDGGGGEDTLRTVGAALDLTGKTLVSIERITSSDPEGADFAVDSFATARLIHGAGLRDTVTATGLTLTSSQRNQLFKQNGVEVIVDASGTFTADRAQRPSRPELAVDADSGASSRDNITNLAAATFTGRADPGDTVVLLADGAAVGSGVADADGRWSILSSPLADGVHLLSAQARDAQGDVSALSGARSVTIDTTTAAPTLNLSSSGLITGTAEPGGQVVLVAAETSFEAVVKASAGGTWKLAAPLGQAVQSFTALSTDLAGNTAASAGALVIGTAAAEALAAGGGDDQLAGAGGNDTLSGGEGNDLFLFAAGFGRDRIADFTPGAASEDLIQLPRALLGLDAGASQADAFAAVLARTTTVNGDAVISLNASDVITLAGVTRESLVGEDFAFV